MKKFKKLSWLSSFILPIGAILTIPIGINQKENSLVSQNHTKASTPSFFEVYDTYKIKEFKFKKDNFRSSIDNPNPLPLKGVFNLFSYDKYYGNDYVFPFARKLNSDGTLN